MKKFLYLAALALVAAALVPVVALADDPLASIKADIGQLQTDVKASTTPSSPTRRRCRTTRRASSAPTRRRRRRRSRPTSSS